MQFKVVLFVSFLLMLLSTAPCLAADTAVVTGETLTVVTGETIEYRVSISGNPGITGLGLKLSFDTDALALSYTDGEIDCVQGDFSGRGSLYCGPTADGCQILWSHTSDVATDGTLFTLRLTVKEDAIPGEYPIRIQNVSRNTVNKAEERVPLTCRSGSITVRTYQQLIYGEAVTALQGDEFSFSVSLQDNPGIASCDISVQFDRRFLSLLQMPKAANTQQHRQQAFSGATSSAEPVLTASGSFGLPPITSARTAPCLHFAFR